MEEIVIEAQLRTELKRAGVSRLRKKGFIPAIIYGQKKNPQPVSLFHKQIIGLEHQHRLENTLISLAIKNDNKRSCLIKEIQYDPVHGNIVHVDFIEISLTKAIRTKIPIEATGEAVGVKQDGGILEHVLWEIEIDCLPQDIPHGIKVDITNLKIGDSVHIKDLVIPSGVKVLNSPELVVLTVSESVKEEAPAAEELTGEEAKGPEVIKEKKEVPSENASESKEKK